MPAQASNGDSVRGSDGVQDRTVAVERASGGDGLTPEEQVSIDTALAHVSQVDGVNHFDYTGAVVDGMSESDASEFARGVVLTGGVIDGVTQDAVPNAKATADATAALAGCSGRQGIGWYWWGGQLMLDSCTTSVVINLMLGGVGVVTLAGALSWIGAPAAVVAGAVLTIGAAALGVCGSWGNGIYMNYLYTGTPFCWGQ